MTSPGTRPGRATRLVVAIVAMCGLASAYLWWSTDDTRTLTATFDRTVAVFEGSDVKVMGVTVGRVESLRPMPDGVEVTMAYDADVDLPADVKAVIIAPSVIADRYVQLTPGYVSGPVLADGARLSVDDTAVPVELDRSFEATQELLEALGPDGVNAEGALADVLAVGAQNLDGTGADIGTAFESLADLSEVLSDGSGDLSSTVADLATFTGVLADHDTTMERLVGDLATLSSSLADDGDDLELLLQTMASSLEQVATFVTANRADLTSNVASLTSLAAALVTEQDALAQVLELAPLGFTNLTQAYDPVTQDVRTRANLVEILRNLDGLLCQAIASQSPIDSAALCTIVSGALNVLPLEGGFDLDGSGQAPLATPPVDVPASPGSPDWTSLLAPLTGSAGVSP